MNLHELHLINAQTWRKAAEILSGDFEKSVSESESYLDLLYPSVHQLCSGLGSERRLLFQIGEKIDDLRCSGVDTTHLVLQYRKAMGKRDSLRKRLVSELKRLRIGQA